MKLKRIISSIMMFTILFIYTNTTNCFAAEWPIAPTILSGSAIVMDASTGTILYGYNENAKNYPASITKILTTLIALENAPLTDIITFSHDAVYNIDTGSTHIGINEGEQISMNDALYAVMLASANEVSNGVAEHVAGSNEAFAQMMNEKATSLGCTNSNFVNPHGLHNENHYTTCHDMALISRAALQNDTFRAITSTANYTIGATNLTTETRGFFNHQQMLTGSKYPQYKYDGCIGGKTGYTDSASNTLVTFAQRNGITLITVVMASDFNAQYTDSIALMDYGFNNFKTLSVNENEGSDIKNDLSLFQRYYEIGNDDSAYIYIEQNSSIILPNTAAYTDATKDIQFFQNVNASTGENVIGEVTYTYGDKIVGKHSVIMNMYPTNSLPSVSLPDEIENYSVQLQGDKKTSTVGKLNSTVFDAILVALCVFIIFTIYIAIKNIFKKRRRRSAYFSRRRHSKKYWDDFN